MSENLGLDIGVWNSLIHRHFDKIDDFFGFFCKECRKEIKLRNAACSSFAILIYSSLLKIKTEQGYSLLCPLFESIILRVNRQHSKLCIHLLKCRYDLLQRLILSLIEFLLLRIFYQNSKALLIFYLPLFHYL